MTKIANVISIITHPIFIVIYSFLIYFEMDTFLNKMLMIAAPNTYWLLFSFLIMMVVLFPLISIYLMYKNKVITTYSMPNRKERLPVLFFMITYYSMTYYIFRNWNETLLNLLSPYLSFLFATLILLIILLLVTALWKISLHTASIAGLSGGLMAELAVASEVSNSTVIVIINSIILLFLGVVSFARLYLKAHTFMQTIAGLAIGFSVMFTVVYFQWKI